MAALCHDPLLASTVLASLGAGIVHAAVAPEHTAWLPSVVFFLALAAFQIGWAAAAVFAHGRAVRPVLALGAAVNLAAVATWALSRTQGMPFGPHQGVAEPAARADVIAAVLGAVVVLAAGGLAAGWHPVARLRQVRPAWSTPAGGIAVSALSIVALTGVSGHAHSLAEHADHATVTATSEADPSVAKVAACKSTARVASDAALAKALSKANGKQAAIERAERAGQKRLKTAVAACDGSAARPATGTSATTKGTPAQPAKRPASKADDGHNHGH